MENKRGISLVVLVITIIVMIVLSSTIIYISSDMVMDTKQGAFALDLEQIEDLTKEYYLNNNELPAIGSEYTKATLVALITEGAEILSDEITINGDDSAKFLRVDLSKLDISNITRGMEDNGDTTDIYVIATDSLNVYYLKGEEIGGEYYFSLTEKLTDKIQVDNTETIDTSNINITNTTSSIKLTKSTNDWTNTLTVKVDTELATGETLKYYIAEQDVTTTVTGSEINISNILAANTTIKNTFYASEQNKVMKIQKISNEKVIAENTINLSNLDILPTNITNLAVTYTNYETYRFAKMTGYSDLGSSGIKEVRILYTQKLDSVGNTTAYYDDLPATITKEYVSSSGISFNQNAIKLPTDVKAYSVVFIDNAGNISDMKTFAI